MLVSVHGWLQASKIGIEDEGALITFALSLNNTTSHWSQNFTPFLHLMLRCKENALYFFWKGDAICAWKITFGYLQHTYLSITQGCLFVLSATIEISQTVFLKGNWGALLMLLESTSWVKDFYWCDFINFRRYWILSCFFHWKWNTSFSKSNFFSVNWISDQGWRRCTILSSTIHSIEPKAQAILVSFLLEKEGKLHSKSLAQTISTKCSLHIFLVCLDLNLSLHKVWEVVETHLFNEGGLTNGGFGSLCPKLYSHKPKYLCKERG